MEFESPDGEPGRFAGEEKRHDGVHAQGEPGAVQRLVAFPPCWEMISGLA